MKGIRRIRQRLCALPLALACLAGLAACGGPDFGSFSKELEFGDKQISDTQTTYVMKIPEGKLGDLIGPIQIQWVIDQYGDPPAHTGAVAVGTKKAAKDLLRKSPELQCRALENTYQEESSDEGKWEYKDSSCRKQRKLSWLEKTLWNMYQVQSDSTIEWLSTSRNTLVAANDTVSTLQANATPNYDSWFAPVNRYLRIAQGVLVAAAAISLIVLSARIVWNIGQGGEGRLLDRIGWILLGVLLGSIAGNIVDRFAPFTPQFLSLIALIATMAVLLSFLFVFRESDLIALTEEPEDPSSENFSGTVTQVDRASSKNAAAELQAPKSSTPLATPRPRFQDRCLEVAAAFELSPKETEVMILFAKGRSAARIQEELFISKGTVSTHLRHIYQKMDVHSKQEMLDVIEGVIRE